MNMQKYLPFHKSVENSENRLHKITKNKFKKRYKTLSLAPSVIYF